MRLVLDASPESALRLFVNVDRNHLVCILQGTQCLQRIIVAAVRQFRKVVEEAPVAPGVSRRDTLL
jgi:hypothetical protein